MVKYWHHEFPSDVFTLLECAGANLEIYGALLSILFKILAI